MVKYDNKDQKHHISIKWHWKKIAKFKDMGFGKFLIFEKFWKKNKTCCTFIWYPRVFVLQNWNMCLYCRIITNTNKKPLKFTCLTMKFHNCHHTTVYVSTLGYQINVQHVLFFFQNFQEIKNFLKPISLDFVVFSIAIW